MIFVATAKDLPSCIAIERECFLEDAFSKRQFLYLLQKANSITYLITPQEVKKSPVVGYAVLLFRARSTVARLYGLAILPNWRGHKLSLLLLKKAEEFALKKNCNRIRLEVHIDNRQAQQIYQKNGYILFGRYIHYYQDGGDALRFEKKL